MRWSNNFSPLSQFFSSLLHPQSIFCTTALPPLIHQRKSPANFLYKQVRLWLQLPGTCSPTKVTQAQTSPETTHTLPESLQHARRCCIDICSMICIETDRASVCVWPNSCWRERLLLNSTPSKNGTADVHQLNDKLLICFYTLLFTSVLFRSESVRPLRESAS